MKNTKTSNEKSAAKADTEKAAKPVATEAKSKKTSPSSKSPIKSKETITEAKSETSNKPISSEEKPKKPSPTAKSAKKSPTAAAKPVTAISAMTMPERVGLTAGSIWNYLDSNGASPTAKLVREIPEEEKIIQRSIGWLAQEGKITIDTIDRVETLRLRD